MARDDRGAAPAPREGDGGRRTARQKLDAIKDQLGTVSDDRIAEIAGVSRGIVGAYRREHNIAAYDGYLWTAGRKPRAARRDSGEPTTDAPVRPGRKPRPPAASEGAEPADPKGARRGAGRRGSRLDAFRDIVGTLSDGEVARRANMTREAVRIYRKKHGIEAFDGPGAGPAEETGAEAAAGRRRGRPAKLRASGEWGWRVRTAGGEERLVLASDLASAVSAAAGLGEIVAVERLLQVA
jgi:hypothetical protein